MILNQQIDDIRDLRVLIWGRDTHERQPGQFIYREASKQGLQVEFVIGREEPKPMIDKVKSMIRQNNLPHCIFNFCIRSELMEYYDWFRELGIKQVWWYADQCDEIRTQLWNDLKDKPDAIIFATLENAERFKDYAQHVVWIPQYFDAEHCKQHDKLPVRLDPNKPIYDLCFLGTCDERRECWATDLLMKFKCAFSERALGILDEIYGWDMAAVYAQSKIAFNIRREIYGTPGAFTTSNRAFNAMGSGCFFLNYPVNQMDLLWQKGIHCATYDDNYEALEHEIRYWLSPKNEEKREQIARAGQMDVLKYHTLEQRIGQYWQVMLDIQNGNQVSGYVR